MAVNVSNDGRTSKIGDLEAFIIEQCLTTALQDNSAILEDVCTVATL